jgi:hypothetical protein
MNVWLPEEKSWRLAAMNRRLLSSTPRAVPIVLVFAASCTKEKKHETANRAFTQLAGGDLALASMPQKVAALIPEAGAMRLRAQSDGYRVLATAQQKLAVEVTLPSRASERAVIQAETLRLEVTALDTMPAQARSLNGTLRYADAYGPGTEMIQVPTELGTEDYVRLDTPPRNSLRYRVALNQGVAGLRMVSTPAGRASVLHAPQTSPELDVNVGPRRSGTLRHIHRIEVRQ